MKNLFCFLFLFIAMVVFLFGESEDNAKNLPAQAVDISAMACRPNLKPVPGIPQKCSLERKTVWAHYVPWHQAFTNYLRCQEYYEYSIQRDETFVDSCRREIALAQACGIDGFLIDNGGDGAIWETRALFKAAEGTSFLIAVCIDFPFDGNEDSYVNFTVDMIQRYSATIGIHPNYAKMNGKMILASFSPSRVSANALKRIRDELHEKGIDYYFIFDVDDNDFWVNLENRTDYREQGDMFYSFGPSHRGWNGAGEPVAAFRETFERLNKWAAEGEKPYMLGIHPGYLGRWLLDMGATIAFRGYDKIWDCFFAVKPEEANWLQLTSWNDFAETAFYPRAFDMGASCEVFQALTEQYFRQKPAPEQLEPKLYFAYDRETIPGTLLRIEALNAPIHRAGKVTLTGRILGNDGQMLAELEEKTLETSEFGRFDWLVPSAPLAVSNALVPEITISYQGEDGATVTKTRKLPHAMMKIPWIQNNSQVRTSFHGLAEDIDSALSITQKGNLLTADLEFNSPEPIVRATLWKNDRIIGDFRPDVAGRIVNFSLFCKPGSPDEYEIRLINGYFTGSSRRFGFSLDIDNPWLSESSQIIPPGYVKEHSCQAVFQENGTIQVLKNKEIIGTVEPQALPDAGTIWFGDQDVSLKCINLNLASPVNPVPFTGHQSLKILVNDDRHERDQFFVFFMTADGKIGFSQVVAPFCKENSPRPMTLLNTYVNNQTRTERMGYLDETISKEQSTGVYMVNPLCVRRALWNFDIDERNALSERAFSNENILPMLKTEGPDGSNCLVFDGKNEITMCPRVYPIATSTIEFDLFIPDDNLKYAYILTSYNFYRGYDNLCIRMLEDGHLSVICGGNSVLIRSESAINLNQWNHVKFVFKEHSALLYVNDTLQGSEAIPLWRSHFNGYMIVGDKSNGFIGKIDNLRFDGTWE